MVYAQRIQRPHFLFGNNTRRSGIKKTLPDVLNGKYPHGIYPFH